MDFARVLADLAQFYEERGARFGLAGGLALHAHGITRATTDVDILVEDAAKPSTLLHLASQGYSALYVSEGFSNHLHRDARHGRIDCIYLDPHTANLLFTRARPVALFGRTFLVPAAEHLAAMKAQAIKDDPRRKLRDMADVLELLALPGVDAVEIRSYFEKRGLQELFDALTNE